ncbi:hypothetical protein ACHAQH_006027 [Verticillium albo-atrum]
MSSPSESHARREVHYASHPCIEDGKLLFDDGRTQRRVPLEEIIFVIKVSLGMEPDLMHYMVYQLQEDASNTETPYRLCTFVADALPQELLDQHLISWPRHLHSDSDIHVVVSTGSGLGMASKFWDLVLQPILKFLIARGTSNTREPHGGSYNLLITKTANCVKDFAKTRWSARESSSKNETIILLSGDGGIVDLLNGTTSSSPTPGPRPSLALIPLGTANALFHSLHKPLYSPPNPPSPLVLALRTLVKGTPAPLPSFLASFPDGATLVSEPRDPISHLHGAIVASYGFHAQLVWESDTPAYRAHGAARFGMVAADLLAESHAYRAEVDGAVSPDAGWGYILATLVSNLERTFTISPASEPLGRRLRVVRFGAVGGERTMDIMKGAYDEGKHVGMEGVGYEEVEGLKVTIREEDARWRKVCVDGTIVELPEGESFEVKSVEGALFDVFVDPLVKSSGS